MVVRDLEVKVDERQDAGLGILGSCQPSESRIRALAAFVSQAWFYLMLQVCIGVSVKQVYIIYIANAEASLSSCSLIMDVG